MDIGMIGLGRMGGNMSVRLVRGGHRVVGYARTEDSIREITSQGAEGANSVADLVSKLQPPRAVWAMVPSGAATQSVIDELSALLEAGDTIIDGGNSRYTESKARAEALASRGIHFIDAGTSGGVWGLEEGYCLMVGGPEEACERLRPVFETLAPPNGYQRVGPSGAGHFVKMVHNGIEYALMEGYAEGFEILKASQFDLDLGSVAELWRHGSVVRSWLLDLTAGALEEDPELANLSDWVDDSGEGRWTLEVAVDSAVPAPAIAAALFARFRSRQDQSFAGKLLAAMRHQFGGHAVRK